MKKFLSNLLALLCINSFAIAQSNFVKSVVIKSNGDSLFGSIDYRNWKNNPQTITFIGAAGERQSFDASSIRGFHVPSENETYTSFSVKMDMLPGDQDQAIKNNFNHVPIDSSFK